MLHVLQAWLSVKRGHSDFSLSQKGVPVLLFRAMHLYHRSMLKEPKGQHCAAGYASKYMEPAVEDVLGACVKGDLLAEFTRMGTKTNKFRTQKLRDVHLGRLEDQKQKRINFECQVPGARAIHSPWAVNSLWHRRCVF